jgi:AcrR family transcriptional regulator
MPGAAYNSPRRREAAAQTRQAVLKAAHRLFVERGYMATSIHDIASAAQVALATVYASVGGKPQLLHEVIAVTTSEAAQRGAAELADPRASPVQVVTGYVRSIRQAVQDHGDIAELVLSTAFVDASVAHTAVLAEQAFRQELHAVATRLSSMGALSAEPDDAVDVLAYYLGYPSWRRLTVGLGWDLDRAQAWLTGRIIDALIAPETRHDESPGPVPRQMT